MPERIAVGDRVRLTWPAARDGYAGKVVACEDGVYFVKLADPRWANMPPVPVRRNELRPD